MTKAGENYDRKKKKEKKKWLISQTCLTLSLAISIWRTGRQASTCLTLLLAVIHYEKLAYGSVNEYYVPSMCWWHLGWQEKQGYPIPAVVKIWSICLK
jgi:hypothetical protein